MATQGVLSILLNGKVIAKAIVGADGYNMPKIADDVRKYKIQTGQGLFDLCCKHGLGGGSLIVQYAPDKWISDCVDDELPNLYADKFSDPRFNPRWSFGTADYVEVVDMTPNVKFTCNIK